MDIKNIRNIAIIAHVDHGKTTLVDRLLQEAGVYRANEEVKVRVLDSNDQEKERGITILSKNVSIKYNGVKINIIDTPGHADFGGEVERVLKMADGCLILVDAFEGTMPQTRFVLSKAIAENLMPIVVINKVDRENSDPMKALDSVFDLMVSLGASDRQLDFETVYTSATEGFSGLDMEGVHEQKGMKVLLDAIVGSIPAPTGDAEAPFVCQIASIDYSPYTGRNGTGRIISGKIKKGENIKVVNKNGEPRNGTVKILYTFEELGKTEIPEASVGDIVAIAGVEDVDIGDTFFSQNADAEKLKEELDIQPIQVEEPTISIIFDASTSPLLGQEGKLVTSRQIKDRLFKEAESNIAMKISELANGSGVLVSGRGILHLSVLMESMRREGFEFQVSRPKIIMHNDEKTGKKLEPIELAVIDVSKEFEGKAIGLFGGAGGEMVDMIPGGGKKDDTTHIEFKIPTRGILGLRSALLNVTKGNVTFFHSFHEYGDYRGDLGGRSLGSLIAMETSAAIPFALGALQARGTLFVGPGDTCYEGMIVGQSTRQGDMVVNIAKSKQLTNMRSSSSDKAVILSPPATFTIEEALEYIEDDELVEITPKSVRMRKKLLTEKERRRSH